MLRLLPKTFAAVAVLGSSLLWAQADVPPPPPTNAGAAADAATEAPADASADAAVETPPADASAGADATTDADVPPAPAPDASVDANADADVNARPNADARVNAGVRGGAKADANTDTNARGRARTQNGRTEIRGGAGVRSQAGTDARVDLSRRPALGVTFRTQGDALVISRVFPNSPAARMGLRPGDRIVRFNGQDYSDTQLFIDAAGQASLDDDAEIVYFRDGQNMTGSVRFMPWSQVYVDDDGEIETQRRVLRPGLNDADDVDDEIEDAVEEGRAVPVQPVPQVIPNPVPGEVEIDND
jgi:hypothetical protein